MSRRKDTVCPLTTQGFRLLSTTAALWFLLSPSVTWGQTGGSPSTDGPTIDLAPEHKDPGARPALSIGAGTTADPELVRGMTDQRFKSAEASASNTSIGGYGEVLVEGTAVGRDGEREWVADVARLVLFVAHSFNDRFRVYTELEVEHALSCASCPGGAELEQGYVDWRLLRDTLGLRAGLILVPIGIINQWHEPPVFHGVVRPRVDTVIIPSTWREIGIGVFGKPVEGLRYEAYAMTGLDPNGFSADGIRGGRQGGAFARANAWAGVGRIEVEPLLGFVIGASVYASDLGENGEFYTKSGERVDLSLPLIGWAADARWRRAGFEWRMLFAEWHLPESEAQMATYDASGNPLYPDARSPVPTLARGAYVEAAYDVLHPFGVSHQLLPFARLEHYNTQAAVPDGFAPNPTFSIRELTVGATYRPIQQIVVKADYQLRNRKLGYDETQLNFGVGFMY